MLKSLCCLIFLWELWCLSFLRILWWTCEMVKIVSHVSLAFYYHLQGWQISEYSNMLLCDISDIVCIFMTKESIQQCWTRNSCSNGCLFDCRLAIREMFLFALVNPLDLSGSYVPLYIWTDIWPLSLVNELLIPVVTTVNCSPPWCPRLDRGGSAQNTSMAPSGLHHKNTIQSDSRELNHTACTMVIFIISFKTYSTSSLFFYINLIHLFFYSQYLFKWINNKQNLPY